MARQNKKNRNGMGSKPVRRNGSYTLFITLGKRPDGTLVRKRVTALTEDECKLKARELQVLFGRGLLGGASTITFEEYAHQWLQRHSKHITPSTLSSYHYELGYAFSFFGKKRLSEIRPLDVRVMVDGLSHYRTQRGNKTLSTRTQRNVLDRVHSVFEDALGLELITRNPAAGQKVNAPRIEKIGIALEPQQQAVLLNELYSTRHYFGLYLALTTGLRKGELLALKKDRDVDLINRLIHVRESRDRKVHATKTKAAVRSVPLSASTVKAIQEWYERLECECKKAGSDYQDSGFLLVDELGNPIHPDTLLQALDRVIARIRGVEQPNQKKSNPKKLPKKEKPTPQPIDSTFPSIRLHDLRHTAATNWLVGAFGPRIPVEVVSRWLGHASPATTMQVYAHVLKTIVDKHAPLVHDIPQPTQPTQARATA